MTEKKNKGRSVRRRVCFSKTSQSPFGTSPILRYIASFLPYREQFGTLRTISPSFLEALPPEPNSPQPAFTVRLDVAQNGIQAVCLGTYTLPCLKHFLQEVKLGSVLLPIAGTAHFNILKFYFCTVNDIPFPTPQRWGSQDIVGTTTEDVYVGLEDVDPEVVASRITKQNRARKFLQTDVDLSSDQVLGQLWLAAERRQQETQYRERRQVIIKEIQYVLPKNLIVMVNDYLPEYRFRW